MPTIAASMGQSFMPAAIRAELPLTIRTVSPTPASNGVDSDQIRPFGFAVRIHRPSHEQLGADELGILPGGDNGPDDAGEDHRTACLAATGGLGLAERP